MGFWSADSLRKLPSRFVLTGESFFFHGRAVSCQPSDLFSCSENSLLTVILIMFRLVLKSEDIQTAKDVQVNIIVCSSNSVPGVITNQPSSNSAHWFQFVLISRFPLRLCCPLPRTMLICKDFFLTFAWCYKFFRGSLLFTLVKFVLSS